MIKFSADAVKRIDDRRRIAESDLNSSLAAIQGDDITPYLQVFTLFAIALYDAEADEFVSTCKNLESFKTLLPRVARRIIESILPDESLAIVRTRRPDNAGERPIIQEVGSQAIYEEESSGELKRAGEYVQGIFAQHGYWERYMPSHMRFLIRSRDNACVREELSHALQQREFYWIGAFALRVQPATRPYNLEQIRPTKADTSVQPPKLNLELVGKFIEDEGYKNDDLAAELGISLRAVSSLRNDGEYHGRDALTKLANLMKCEIDDLFLP